METIFEMKEKKGLNLRAYFLKNGETKNVGKHQS